MMDLSHEIWRYCIDKGFEAITSDPRFLFEDWGGPPRQPPELVVARLYGRDEELVDELVLDGIYAEVRLPARTRPKMTDDADPTMPRAATFGLRSGFARVPMSEHLLFDMGELDKVRHLVDPTTGRLTITCLRYLRSD